MHYLQPYLLCLLCVGASTAFSQSQPETPKVAGVVTDPGTAEAFRVNDVQVLCSAGTENLPETNLASGSRIEIIKGCTPHFPGQGIKVYGTENKHSHAIDASRLEIAMPQTHKVAGVAVIDQQPSDAGGEWAVRADGYKIVVPPAAQSKFDLPLASKKDVAANVWVRYSGTQRIDGTVLAESVEFAVNEVNTREDDLNAKREFDPTAVTDNDRQSGLSKAVLGRNPKRLPAHTDAAMQARVDALGARLVPAYQRAMPDGEPTKISFRFQVVDEPGLHDALTLSNGIILVPYQVIDRLENDDQLATVLADNIATALEKQELRMIPAQQKLAAADVVGTVGAFFVPGLGLATGFGGGAVAARMLRHEEEQSGRVSLALLNDAGFRIAEAPKTWWLLVSLKPKSVSKIDMPYRARYLYTALTSTWQPKAQSSSSKALAAMP